MANNQDYTIRVKRGTANEWAVYNPILGVGELGYDTTNRRLKVGDGLNVWSNVKFATGNSFDVARDAGFDGTLSEWLESLKGEDGVGPTNHITVGNVTTGPEPKVELRGESPNQIIDFTFPAAGDPIEYSPATPTKDGLMPKEDKATLDSASSFGKDFLTITSQAAARTAIGFSSGSLAELETGTSTVSNRVWSPKVIADYVKAGDTASLDEAKSYTDSSTTNITNDTDDKLTNYVPKQMSQNQNVVVGERALNSAFDLKVRNNNAFGIGALYSATRARYNDAFGLNALYSLDSGVSESDSTFKATRNSAFGSNTQRFSEIGYNNISMGRNSLQCNVTGNSNVILGSGSAAGLAPYGYSGEIENQIPQNVNRNVAVGTDTIASTQSDDNTAVGYQALRNLIQGKGNTALGSQALYSLESKMFPGGGWKINLNWNDIQYEVINSTQIKIFKTDIPFTSGNLVELAMTDTENQRLRVSEVSSTYFIVDTPKGNSAISPTGLITVVSYAKSSGRFNNYNTALGVGALQNLDNVETDVGTSGSNTAVGVYALKNMENGDPATKLSNSTGIGVNSRASGDFQVVLGTSGTTPYAYSALQVRSDARDKADVKDTELGLSFIEKVRPVDFKYDYRIDYQEVDENGEVTKVNEKDGSKKRNRYHHGVIAQEIKEVIDETGIDFGGYQDHTTNGGNDVLTIGYEEFIGPLIKAVQELSKEVKDLKKKLGE